MSTYTIRQMTIDYHEIQCCIFLMHSQMALMNMICTVYALNHELLFLTIVKLRNKMFIGTNQGRHPQNF